MNFSHVPAQTCSPVSQLMHEPFLLLIRHRAALMSNISAAEPENTEAAGSSSRRPERGALGAGERSCGIRVLSLHSREPQRARRQLIHQEERDKVLMSGTDPPCSHSGIMGVNSRLVHFKTRGVHARTGAERH
ncbi:hypothetical protein INR49_009295 [Caranx melampygus]|nr:hypothetical protein INR49_009295 [Caranx melampygus]